MFFSLCCCWVKFYIKKVKSVQSTQFFFSEYKLVFCSNKIVLKLKNFCVKSRLLQQKIWNWDKLLLSKMKTWIFDAFLLLMDKTKEKMCKRGNKSPHKTLLSHIKPTCFFKEPSTSKTIQISHLILISVYINRKLFPYSKVDFCRVY